MCIAKVPLESSQHKGVYQKGTVSIWYAEGITRVPLEFSLHKGVYHKGAVRTWYA